MADSSAVLFDVDGTLIDSNYLHTVTWWEALHQNGHTVPMALVHRSIGMGTDQLLDHVLGEDRDRDETETLDAAHQALYGRYWPSLVPFAGAAHLLRACAARGWTVVLASSASQRELDVLRKVLDADDAIAAATNSDDVDTSKPAPDLVSEALKKVGADSARSFLVGDTVWDVQAAARAGVRCLAVQSGGFSRDELLTAGAAEVYEDVATLLAHLDDSLLAEVEAKAGA
ncbi:MAG TPA: HAD family hydrolase [Actinocrinis sp.]|nr:HAD family hydrolase [Actinocrinis sp.]